MTLDMGAMMTAIAGEPINQSSNNDDSREKWIVHLASTSIGPKIVHLLNNIIAVCYLIEYSISCQFTQY